MRQRLPEIDKLMENCRLCPHECGVNRIQDELGKCRIGNGLLISSANLHFGEEPPISGWKGSGTVFMTSCNLRCKFCQNFPISQLRHGVEITCEGLAEKMLDLQNRGAHNINFVTPTPQAAMIFKSLLIAFEKGLLIPIVYNCGGYESIEMLTLWDGIVDIYLPDIKYTNDEVALEISAASEYVRHNSAALIEMQRQVGVLECDAENIARRGLLVRHLVLPGNLAGTRKALKFIAENISRETYISLMSQYFPAHRVHSDPVLSRKITKSEYSSAREALEEFGLKNGWIQPLDDNE